ncbi:MAG: phage tail tube protein [Herbaspirillum sp.]
MTIIATGIAKQLRYKKEVTMATLPGPTLAQLLRRVTSNLDLQKATYKSNELRPDYQIANFRHGVRSISGTIAGELSVGTYGDFMSSAVRQAWQTIVTTGSIITVAIASTTGLQGTVTRSAGSFLTDGFKIGDVVRMTGWATTAVTANARNFWITNLTATVMTGQFLDGVTVVPAKIAGDSVTIAQAGKKTWMATTAQTNDSYSIEHWFSDIGQSEVFKGCRISDIDIKLPATGFATIGTAFMGIDMVTAQAAYFTAPSAINPGGALASVNGMLFVGGVQVGLVTGMDIKINGTMTTGGVVGQNTNVDIFAGPMEVSGQMTVYFQDAVMRDMFVNETEASLQAVFTTDNTAAADFMAFVLPRIKIGGATKDDGPKGLIMTMPYQALLNLNGGPSLATTLTTLSIQDSTVS